MKNQNLNFHKFDHISMQSNKCYCDDIYSSWSMYKSLISLFIYFIFYDQVLYEILVFDKRIHH